MRLTEETMDLAAGAQAVCVFVNDEVTEKVLERLSEVGVRCVALRCAGCAAIPVHACSLEPLRTTETDYGTIVLVIGAASRSDPVFINIYLNSNTRSGSHLYS